MVTTQTFSYSFLFFAVLTGCSVITDNHNKTIVCSNDWYALVEKQIPTGEGLGHGPDIG